MPALSPARAASRGSHDDDPRRLPWTCSVSSEPGRQQLSTRAYVSAVTVVDEPTISPALPASPLRSHRKERRDDSRLHLDAGRGQPFPPSSLPSTRGWGRPSRRTWLPPTTAVSPAARGVTAPAVPVHENASSASRILGARAPSNAKAISHSRPTASYTAPVTSACSLHGETLHRLVRRGSANSFSAHIALQTLALETNHDVVEHGCLAPRFMPLPCGE